MTAAASSRGALVIRAAARARTESAIAVSTAQLMRGHLEWIRFALPYDAAQILVFDRSKDQHRQMAQIGYPTQIAQVMTEDFPRNWPKPVWHPVRPGDDLPPAISAEQDGPSSFRQSDLYRLHLRPAGYRDGLTLELNHRGRYVGLANFSSLTEGFYVTELRMRSQAFASLLGHAVSATAQELEAVPLTARAAVVDANGAVASLSGRERARLASLPAFQEAIRPMFAAPQSEVAFVWVSGRAWSKILVRRQLDESAGGQHPLVVIEREIDRPYGLTLMELRVLTRLFTCSTNEQVADALGIGVRTVHTHVSNILSKLGCDRRGHAVASAIRNDLFLPEPVPEASLTHLLQ